MNVTQTPEACYNQWKTTIQAIPYDKVHRCTMPLEVAVQEGARAALLANTYRSRLVNSAVDPAYLDTIAERAYAYAYAVAAQVTSLDGEKSRHKKYLTLKKEGYALRKNIRDSMEYLCSREPELLKILAGLHHRRNDLLMIKDLWSLWKIFNQHKALLIAGSIDVSDVERLPTLHAELLDLLAELDIDPEKVSEAKKTCAKAWTFLWEAVKEIYAAGRFVFQKEPEKSELFYVDYWQEMGKRNAQGKSADSNREAPISPPDA